MVCFKGGEKTNCSSLLPSFDGGVRVVSTTWLLVYDGLLKGYIIACLMPRLV